MSLDKAILSRKEHRKPYYGSKAVDCSCRNHGSCSYCRDNRTAKLRTLDRIKLKEIEEFNSKQEDDIIDIGVKGAAET